MGRLSERYAAALFDISLESGMLKEHYKQAVYICEVIKIPQSEEFLQHPHIPDSAKQDFLQKLFSEKISPDLMGFLYLAIAKNREPLILPSLTAFIDKVNRHSGRVVANVVSAAKLSDAQVAVLHATLSKKLQKQVEISAKVNPDLIGGLYIHVDDRLIDRTVRTQLIKMKESMERGVAE